ncbi:MAG: ATP-binding cassette domain-containing protein [Clostridia bacterium]|nr:ATP-binding cassette domain-containing protein [Clostridia bacterium]MBQ3042694.1 ATP-binding cassette domain-containing protein [Clostridia bacterium]
MNAIEIRNLTKNFGAKQALQGLNMTVPIGSIYGFIGENGSGKSTTEKIICGLIHASGGSVQLFGKPHTDADIRAKMGVLIESPGCFPEMTVWNNLMLQADNLSIENKEEEIRKMLMLVRMEGAAGNKYKNCSLGMKQRVGIAMALLGNPTLLVLDEPINGLDADGMRIMREVLVDIANQGTTVVISSHILGELEKIATHYGIVRGGKMIAEMTAQQLEESCRTFVRVGVSNKEFTKALLMRKYLRVEEDENGYIRVYDQTTPEQVVTYLYENGILINEISTAKIGLEEYYIDLMKGKGAN